MKTDAQTNRDIHIRRVLSELKRTYGMDGILLLEFSHTDNAPRIMAYTRQGEVPPMEEVLLAVGRVIACTAYQVGKQDAENEFDKRMVTNLNDVVIKCEPKTVT